MQVPNCTVFPFLLSFLPTLQKGKKAGKWLPPNAQNVSWWDRTLVTQTAKEFSFTLPEKADQIYVMSINKRKLKKENFKKSKTLVDFSGGSSVRCCVLWLCL